MSRWAKYTTTSVGSTTSLTASRLSSKEKNKAHLREQVGQVHNFHGEHIFPDRKSAEQIRHVRTLA